MPNWATFKDSQAQATALASAIATWLTQCLKTWPAANLMVSGGRSPIDLFERLSHTDLAWSRVRVGLVDERFVPSDHPDSNAGLVRRHLLKHKAAAAALDELVVDDLGLPACVERANARPPHSRERTLVVLGMGDDGHTASWFPDAPELTQALDPGRVGDYIALHPQSAPHARISLTKRAVLRSAAILLPIQGEHKQAVLQTAAEYTDTSFLRNTVPVSHVLNQSETPIDVYWAP